MNAQPTGAPSGAGSAQAADLAAPAVDARNPWLGLASFTEETRSFFYGREDEVAELARRVQRKLLTILFGQSGLGKTSILRAGLVPRLREQSYCPIYVRVDYGRDAPEPAEQIKQAIARSARLAGQWTQPGVALQGESLWEFLHHRDDVLRDEAGHELIPLLIFDQFEEIFTLAQSDEFGRARAARFVEDLADLVENRPPKTLEAVLETDDSAAERFDFARSDYRVLISLREDYLAPLEGLKHAMPSITQNRLRLAPMTGTQALTAVTRPGGKLVTEEVAAAIVRFVAGGAELANAEVEPSLLSLICRELNDARLEQGRSEISLDLLAGSHSTILSNFYERALADQPPAVRRIIEEELLTESGYRENIAEERLVKSFAAAGAAPSALAVLVNRRLLRIEERLDVRRVELTHDVLCGVVKASRDARHEREANAATERLLAEQRERELAARAALVRARKVAAGCILLAVLAIAAAAFAVFSSLRARRAEQVAEQARSGSEHLLGYLTDDFVRELESFGRLNVVAEFAKRQIDYFHSLPPALKGEETTRNGALAMVHFARAERTMGDTRAATTSADEAIALLEAQRKAGDDTESAAIDLALAYSTKAQILDNANDPAGPALAARAAALLKPLVEAKGASAAARRAYVEVLVRIGYEQLSGLQNDQAVATEQLAQRYANELGARDLSNLEMGAYYVEAGAWLVSGMVNAGHNDEAKRVGEATVALADKILEQRPGYRLALHGQQVIVSVLTNVAQNELDPVAAVQIARRSEAISLVLLGLDRDNIVTINNLGVSLQTMGDALWSAGELREAIASYQKSIDDYGRATSGGAGFVVIRGYDGALTAYRQAVLGDFSGAAATNAANAPYLENLRRSEPAGSVIVAIADATDKCGRAWSALEQDDLAGAERIAAEAERELQALKPMGDLEKSQTFITLFAAAHVAGRVAYLQQAWQAAEREEHTAYEGRKVWGTQAIPDRRDLGEVSTWMAMAQARQGKYQDAAATIAPVVKVQRELAAKNRSDKWLPLELAGALYAQALSQPQHNGALLREAASLIDGLPANLRSLRDVKMWRRFIAMERSVG